MHKDIDSWRLSSNLWVGTEELEHKFGEYYGQGFWNVYNSFYRSLNRCERVNNFINIIPLTKFESFNVLLKSNNVIKNLTGIKITYDKIDQGVLVDILQYYLILKNYYIYNNNIYQKIENSKISYKIVGSLTEILYDKFQERVVFFFLNNFPGYFNKFDFNQLIKIYFIKSKFVIESIRDISTQRIYPDFGLIEFTDGIYSIKYDRFFCNKENLIFRANMSTIKHYNKSYSRTRRIKPINWINGIKNALDITNSEIVNEDYVRICLHIINPIHNNIFDKKASLFVYGPSNTGKTSLIVNILNDYFGCDNIGSIINSKNFK
jgi:hypothetical protein